MPSLRKTGRYASLRCDARVRAALTPSPYSSVDALASSPAFKSRINLSNDFIYLS